MARQETPHPPSFQSWPRGRKRRGVCWCLGESSSSPVKGDAWVEMLFFSSLTLSCVVMCDVGTVAAILGPQDGLAKDQAIVLRKAAQKDEEEPESLMALLRPSLVQVF